MALREGQPTLLNCCGVRPDLVPFIVDPNPYRHGRFTPGTRTPIHAPEPLAEARTDYVWILQPPGRDRRQLHDSVRSWGGVFVLFIPKLGIIATRRSGRSRA